jgi:hypothetical protein
MLRRVALVRTDVSEEPSASIIRVARIGELATTLAVTSNRRVHASVAQFYVVVVLWNPLSEAELIIWYNSFIFKHYRKREEWCLLGCYAVWLL